VRVLGTQFEITSGAKIATVQCFEGTVAVDNVNQQSETLTAGQAVRLGDEMSRFTAPTAQPTWLKGESEFTQRPLLEVVEALAIQFNLDVDAENVDLNRNYSGKFNNQNLEKSLEMVFAPMGIKYQLVKDRAKTKLFLR
jgi:transmembrane sensor